MACGYCDVPGHSIGECPERLEDKYGMASDYDSDDDDIRTDGGVENRAPVQFVDATPNNECLGCGAHVTPQTVRGYGDNDGNLYACNQCSTPRDLRQGAGKDPDYNPERDRGRASVSGYHPIFPGAGGDS